MKGRTWTEVQWGVLYIEDEHFRKAGSVETSGTTPSGTYGVYGEDICRYLAKGNANRRVVRQTVVRSETTFGWSEA